MVPNLRHTDHLAGAGQMLEELVRVLGLDVLTRRQLPDFIIVFQLGNVPALCHILLTPMSFCVALNLRLVA